MLRNRNHLAEQYFTDDFRYESVVSASVPESRFKATKQQFSLKYDDFYHDYFRRYGDQVEANVALVSIAFELFRSVYGHLPLAYKNCAISSGTWSHHDAVLRDYHTTDRLSRVVGSEWHAKTIKDNSQRSLERIERIKDLFIEVFFIAPTMFEGSTRVFSKGFGRQLTSIPFQAEEYMAFWNMVIDRCEAFVLDDIRLDTPDIERIERELEMAQYQGGLLYWTAALFSRPPTGPIRATQFMRWRAETIYALVFILCVLTQEWICVFMTKVQIVFIMRGLSIP